MTKFQCKKCRWEGEWGKTISSEYNKTIVVCPRCYTEVKQDYEFFTVQCPQCSHQWSLRAEDLRIRSCESGGIYTCEIECSKCNFTQDLMD